MKEKKPRIRSYNNITARTSTALARKFGEDNCFGFLVGKRSKITIVDVDSRDDRILADALSRHGHTPVVVKTGSGHFHIYYRHNGESRQIRPNPELPIDILGSGIAVAPPSREGTRGYRFIQGSLDDFAALPTLLGPSSRLQPGKPARGVRNNSLWRHCMHQARHCDDERSLVDVAETFNDSLAEPLSSDEVLKTASSAWKYEMNGLNRFGRHGVWLGIEEVDQLVNGNHDILVLLTFLRAHNGRESEFFVTNGLHTSLGMTLKRLRRARSALERSHIVMIRAPTTHAGPALYRWRDDKGGQI